MLWLLLLSLSVSIIYQGIDYHEKAMVSSQKLKFKSEK